MDGILALVKMIAGLAAVLLLIVLTLKYLNRFTSQANENFRVMKKDCGHEIVIFGNRVDYR